MTRFLLIRHATTAMVGKRIAGRMAGVHLSEEGIKQASALAEQLEGLPVHVIYSSPLERTMETAQAIAKRQQLAVQPCDALLEIDFGSWTNRTIEELKGDAEFRLFNSFRSATQVPGGEWMMEAQTRAVTCIQKLSVQHRGEAVVLVSHGDLIKAALAYYAGMHLDMMQRIEISPASISIVDVFPETARITLVNYTGEIKNGLV